MIKLRRYLRWKNNEHLPIILLMIISFAVIHFCNKHDESTANQKLFTDLPSDDPKVCPLYPLTLKGLQKPDMSEDLNWTDIEKNIEHVHKGGYYSPPDCEKRQELAIIIPFRNREFQLRMLLNNLHPFLQRQKRSYQIFVVEQWGNGTFNKGLIMNVAFKHAYESSRTKFQCFMFHDVDLLPENDYNIYECDKNEPRHLAPAVDELRYFLMYNDLVGGVLAITKEQFLRANGWSNLYWGWGFEDDDMNHRLRHSVGPIGRPPNSIGRYKMIRHQKQTPSTKRFETLQKWLRYPLDGFRQLALLNYSVVHIAERPLFTHILVNFTRNATKTIDHLIEENMKFD